MSALLIPSRRIVTAALVAAGAWSAVAQGAPPEPGTNVVERHALLVGCSTYENYPRLELYGPANDVPMWVKALTNPKGFAFPPANVRSLVGWSKDDPSSRPTHANIGKGFEHLIEQAKPGAQIFILLSGHGTQAPIPAGQTDPLDAANPEPDGLDEVFLPADLKKGDGSLENAIRDDQIGKWLDQIRDKGADVWILFDCCHSGTMTRAVDDKAARGERCRAVDPIRDLGLSKETLHAAIDRASRAMAAYEARTGKKFVAGDKVKPVPAGAGRKGSLAAFYAAQPFERAPELPLPEGVAHLPENYYGLLSYAVLQALEQRQSPISYGDLAVAVAARYRAIRGTRFPTPSAEGDLNREVLGLTVWPARPGIVLERTADVLRVSAGELHGLTTGSVLAVRPPAGQGDGIVGHVRVESAGPATATVAPCPYDGKPAAAAAGFKDLSRCETVRREFGDMRLRLYAGDVPALTAAVDKLAPEVRDMVAVVGKAAEAQWVLRAVTPAQAGAEYGLADATNDTVVLVQNQAHEGTGEAERAAEDLLRRAGQPIPRKVFGRYPVGDARALVGGLERDLPKVFRWRNVWRVANGSATRDAGEAHGLRLEMYKLTGQNDTTGERFRTGPLPDGQRMKIQVKNTGTEKLWVTVLSLSADFGISHLYTGVMEGGQALQPFLATMRMRGGPGVEGLVVFAVPVAAQAAQPDFKFLEQSPLRENTRSDLRPPDRGTPTPFERLLAAAAFNRGTRDIELQVPSTPAILSQTWVIVPKPAR
jgi:hypothetical protein